MSEDDAPLTDDELDALDADITRDMALLRAMDDALIAKVRKFRTALAQRQHSANVREFRPRDPEPGDFRPRPSGGEPPYEPGPAEHGNGDPDLSSL